MTYLLSTQNAKKCMVPFNIWYIFLKTLTKMYLDVTLFSNQDDSSSGTRPSRGFNQNFCYTVGFQLGQGAIEENTVPAKHQVSYQPSKVCAIRDILQVICDPIQQRYILQTI